MSISSERYPRLPEEYGEQVATYPECSYGAVKVTLILQDDRWIRDVILAGDLICKVGQKQIKTEDDLDFRLSDVIGVRPG